MKKLLVLLGAIPALAFAKVPEDGFYTDLGLGVGSVSYYGNSGTTGTVRIDGGYNLNRIIGFQVGVNDYFGTTISNSNLGNYNVNGYAFDASVIPNIPIGANAPVNIFFRVGLGYDAINSPVGNTNSMVDVLGAGVRYDISAHLGLTGQWIARGLLLSPGSASYSQNDFLLNLGLFF